MAGRTKPRHLDAGDCQGQQGVDQLCAPPDSASKGYHDSLAAGETVPSNLPAQFYMRLWPSCVRGAGPESLLSQVLSWSE
jgi:hypothetical protein